MILLAAWRLGGPLPSFDTSPLRAPLALRDLQALVQARGDAARGRDEALAPAEDGARGAAGREADDRRGDVCGGDAGALDGRRLREAEPARVLAEARRHEAGADVAHADARGRELDPQAIEVA